MTETSAPETPPQSRPDPGPGKRLRIRPLHWHVGIWTLVMIAMIAIFITMTSMSLTGRSVALPDWVAQKVLTRMNAAMESGSFTLRRVDFGVTPRGRPQLKFIDVGIKDATGLDLAQLNQVEGGFRLGAALRGHLQPTVVSLHGAQVTLRRFADGSLALSLGQERAATGNFSSLLNSIDAVFTDGLLAGAERVEASDLTITLEDARSGRLWQVTDGRMRVTQTETLVELTVNFDVFNQTEELASTEFSIRSSKANSEASIAARFSNAAATDIAAQSPALAFLSVIDAPISGALRTSIAASGDISELAGTLEIGSGALSPRGGQPALFEGAKVYIDFDPAAQRLGFLGASVESELGTAQGEGHVYLTDFNGAWPGGLLGQVTLTHAVLNPVGVFAQPLTLTDGTADFRVRLDPFTIDIGQAVAYRGGGRYAVTGKINAENEGWQVALDGTVEAADKSEVLALWPLEQSTPARDWLSANVLGGEAFDSRLVFRKVPGDMLRMSGVYNLRNVQVVGIPTLPPIEIERGYVTQQRGQLTAVVETGHIIAPDGRQLDMSGSSYLAVTPQDGGEAYNVVNLEMAGPIRGAMSLLDLEPFQIFANNIFDPDVARGAFEASGRVTFPQRDGPIDIAETDFMLSGSMSDVRSDVLVPDKLLLADQLEFLVTNDAVEISGPAQIGQARASGTWRLPIGPDQGGQGSTIVGSAELSDRALDEFGVGLSEGMVTGRGRGQFELVFSDAAPQLTLRSDLAGVGLTLPGTGWTKSPDVTGSLEVSATLGDRPKIDSISMSAPGLEGRGWITTAEGGGIGEASFERVRLGGWLDAPVVLTGRGPNAPIGIAVNGGKLDMRRADFGSGDRSGAPGPRAPLILNNIQSLTVSEGIRLTDLNADLDLAGGLHGTFAGQVVGGARISGSVAQQDEGSAYRILSSDAGGVLRGAGVFDTARGGDLELVLAPVKGAGTYEGEFSIRNTRVVDAPTMAALLSAVSVVGMLDQLGNDGISFSEVDGRFRLTPEAVTLYYASAVGLSLGISLDGYYNMVEGKIDMQGVISPFYILNALGRVFSPRDGEGLIGFNFDLKGDYDGPEIQVNPLSILTPGAFREIFRRPPPEIPQE